MNKGTHLSAAPGAEGNLSATHIEGISRMRKYRVVGLILSLMLIAAACSESTGTTAAPSAVATTAATEDGAHETGEEAAHDEGEAAHDEGAEDMAEMEADRTIEVALTEFAFGTDPITVSAGETIEFVITNAGAIEHEFRLSNDERIAEHIAGGHAAHEEEEGTGGHSENADQLIVVPPGETASLIVMFGEDTSIYTDVVCLIPGHFEAGMEAGLEYIA